MYILGISGGVRQGNQDGAAALLKNGKIVAAVEEERLIRVKHAPGWLPEHSIRFVLEKEQIGIRDIDYLVFPGETYTDFRTVLSRYMESKFGYCPQIELVHHHDAHAASAFYASGFEQALVLTMDLSGDGISTQVSVGNGRELKLLTRFPKPNSLGIFYSILTQFLGFQRDNDEYKVMGLSSYGKRGTIDLSWLLSYGCGEYQLNNDYLNFSNSRLSNPSKQEPIYNRRVLDKLGQPRLPSQAVTEFHENLAASGQEHLENVILDLLTHYLKKTGLKKVCLAGGVALNCVANQKIMNRDLIDDIYVQPASSDAGLAIGGAYLVAKLTGQNILPMADVYLGPEYDNDEIKSALQLTGVKYQKIQNKSEAAANLLAQNKIIGWFQGRMEFGPRALGNRSILANPCNSDMRDMVNVKVKFRELFRPFCPSVLAEESTKYFYGKKNISPYMTITFEAKGTATQAIPAVVHVDQTARLQTVRNEDNALYYDMLKQLKKQIGHGVVMNTSFNVKGDAIVNTPYQAISTLYGSGMDALILGDYILTK